MNELIKSLFSTQKGKQLYDGVLNAISDYGMKERLKDGVIVGLSGGADSVALLLALLRYRMENDFKVKAVHINHCIRGEEADRDEEFSRNLCVKLGIEFESYKIDVPSLAKARAIGLEEAARDVRYDKFKQIISTESDYSTIAVAHNATDNLETVIFNMMRGSGIVGLSGIRPVRENIIRPLIYLPKELIREALFSAEIDFVVDSTNLSTDYTRNYIRSEIIPKFRKLNDSPERMCTRLSSLLREDSDYLFELAESFLKENEEDGIIKKESIISLKKPVFSRVLMLMCKKNAMPAPEKVHVDSIYNLLGGEDFSVSLPGGKSFVSKGGYVCISKIVDENEEFCFEISEGINKFPNFDSIIFLSKDKNYDCFSNIYKKSIQVKIKFDIINSGLYIRSKADGDSYRFGNMTRKLKKIFNDRKVPNTKRGKVPIFCDCQGILWVPGLPVRDGERDGEEWYITILNPIVEQSNENTFFVI